MIFYNMRDILTNKMVFEYIPNLIIWILFFLSEWIITVLENNSNTFAFE